MNDYRDNDECLRRAVAIAINIIAAAGVVVSITTNNTLSSSTILIVSTASIISNAVYDGDEIQIGQWPVATKVEANVRERKIEQKTILLVL